MAKQKKEKTPKAQQPKGHARTRTFWVLVYVTLCLVMFIGVALILREYVIVPGSYTPPDPMLLSGPTPSPTLPLLPNETPPPTPSPTPYVRRIPVRIYFDDHQLQAEIKPVGLVGNTIDTVPSATIAGWFDEGAPPGDPGNSIVSGHVRWKGKRGTFAILHDMVPGEQVTIEFADGSVRYFEAVSKNTYAVADFPSYVTDLDGDTRLTLITCLGDYDQDAGMSLSRVVVECVEKKDLRADVPAAAGEA